MFINRKKELEALEKRYRSAKAELFVLYGRRRVGKTELLKEFAKDKRHVYFTADMSIESQQLKEFSRRIMEELGSKGLQDVTFPNWDALFDFIASKAQEERLIIIIDEFSYLVAANPAIPSILQRIWDQVLQYTKIFLILCGSFIGMMERQVLNASSPLYGRRTAQWLLTPMDFFDISGFFPNYDTQSLVECYAILGGIPAYLLQFQDNVSVYDNILENVLLKGCFLYDEVRFLLMQELKDTRIYFSILKSIAQGHTRINDIVMDCNIDKGTVSRYLDILQDMYIVERELPVTEKHPEKSRKGLYRIKDNFIEFWFKFVFPNISYLEEGLQDDILKQHIMPNLPHFVSASFETICMQYLKRLTVERQMPFTYHKIGRWWNKNTEIDIIAYDDTNILYCECKWRNQLVDIDVLNDLKAKTTAFRAETKMTATEYFAVFSKSGFTDRLKAAASIDQHILLYDLNDISKPFHNPD